MERILFHPREQVSSVLRQGHRLKLLFQEMKHASLQCISPYDLLHQKNTEISEEQQGNFWGSGFDFWVLFGKTSQNGPLSKSSALEICPLSHLQHETPPRTRSLDLWLTGILQHYKHALRIICF